MAGDPASSNSMLDILTKPVVLLFLGLLGAYGAVEAFFRLLRGIPKFWHWLFYKWRNRHLSRDFYFAFREAAYRINSDGRQYLYVRKEKVVALQSLSQIPISFRWTGEGTCVASIEPASLAIVDAPRVKGQTRTRKLINLDKQLEKGEAISYVFTVKCTVTGGGQPETMLGSFSSHRVDKLLLRMIFPLSRMPLHVWAAIRNDDGTEVSRNAINDFDPITGEYRLAVKWPEAHLTYNIEWEY